MHPLPHQLRAVRRLAAAGLVGVVPALTLLPAPAGAQWTFTDVSTAAGAGAPHTLAQTVTQEQQMSGGAACGDYNNDGWIDLYHLGGDTGQNHLLRNNGNGTFSDVAGAAGVSHPNSLVAGACFADWNGDGWLDLMMGGLEGTRLSLFENNQDGTFTDVSDSAGVLVGSNTWAGAFGDIDNDGDLDLAIAHWSTGQGPGHFWRNDGNSGFSTKFTSADLLIGYVNWRIPPADYTFAYNFVDLDSDGWTDFVCASDFFTSHVFMNDGDGTFTDVTDTTVVYEDNGMGTTVADYDRDGDIDWFVTSVYDTAGVKTGNRMYRNLGNGTFEDATDHANVRDGQWGWGASFQDLNNDGWLDIFHTNGWLSSAAWQDDPCRLFVSNGDETFTEMAAARGADVVSQGRGVCCFDYDRDGDIDLFIANMNEPAVLLRNDGGNANNWLGVKLVGPSPNTEQIGARITATVAGASQLWELRCGNNYNSQDPAEAHFGLGSAPTVDRLDIQWTDGTVTTMTDVAANQLLTVNRSAVDAPVVTGPRAAGLELLSVGPNPFRTDTAVRFSLGRAGRVRVRIYDTGGRLVRTLTDRALPAGTHSTSWDGRDDTGHKAGSGVYYYRVSAAGEVAKGRIALVR